MLCEKVGQNKRLFHYKSPTPSQVYTENPGRQRLLTLNQGESRCGDAG